MTHIILSRFHAEGKRPSRTAGSPISGEYAWQTLIVDSEWAARILCCGSSMAYSVGSVGSGGH